MKLDEKWFELYESLYGTTFNKILTIGTPNEGYENYPIKSLAQLRQMCEENYPKKEFYISFYDYDSDELAIKWDPRDNTPYEKYSKKNCILFRFIQNTDIIKEETKELTDVQKFMFTRRTLNLGNNKEIFEDVRKVYDAIEELFNIKSWVLFNGYNECYLYVFTESEMKLKNPTLTYYYFYKFIEKYTGVKTLIYSQIEPFSQILSLPGSQNNNTRLYTKPYDITLDYLDILKNSQSRKIESFDLRQNQDTSSLEELFKTVDDEITKRKSEGNTNIWDYELDELFNEKRSI